MSIRVSPTPPEVAAFSRLDYGAAALAAILALSVYIPTLPPTFTGDDSAEFITAAYSLGIAHPPGYPLFCIWGKLFTFIPIGTIAWRVAFMSAFFGAATCFVVSLIVTRLTGNRLASVGAAAMLAVSSEFWKWNSVVETYSLNAFLVVLCVLALLTWHESRQTKYLYLFAIAYGLGLCNHHTMAFLGPLFGIFVIWSAVAERSGDTALTASKAKSANLLISSHIRTYLFMVLIACGIAAIIHLYLPLRANANPYSNWGNPQTWDNFWHHVLRKQYTRGFVRDARSLERFAEQMLVFAKHYGHQFTPWLAILPALGLYPLWKRQRAACALMLGLFVYVAVGLTVITNFGFDRESLWYNTKFFIPAYIMAAVFAGAALAWIMSLKPQLTYAGIPLALMMFVAPLVSHYRANDKSDYYFAYDFGVNLLKTLDRDALYFPSTDHFIYPLFYLQEVEKLRPDVTIVTKYGYPQEDLYKRMPLDLRGGNKGRIKTRAEKTAVEEWIIANSGRPAYFSRMRAVENATVQSTGLLYRVFKKGEKLANVDYWSQYHWHSLNPEEARGDMTAESILADYHFALGRDYFLKNDKKRALEEMEMAVGIAPTRSDLVNNVGGICSDYGELAAAEKYFVHILGVDPEYTTALRNLARIYQTTERYADAATTIKRLIEIETRKEGGTSPYIAILTNDLGGVQLSLKDYDSARKSFEFAQRVFVREAGEEHPYTLRAMSNLAIALRALGDNQQADTYTKRAVEILTKVVGKDHPFTQAVKHGVFIPSGE